MILVLWTRITVQRTSQLSKSSKATIILVELWSKDMDVLKKKQRATERERLSLMAQQRKISHTFTATDDVCNPNQIRSQTV